MKVIPILLITLFCFDCTYGQSSFVFSKFDIKSGSQGAQPRSLLAADKLYFTADDGIHGFEPWISDGTIPGTYILKDILGGPNHSAPSSYIYFKNNVYFAAIEPTSGNELWVTDGTTSGTKLFKDIESGILQGSPKWFAVGRSKLYFSASTKDYGDELWLTDGTEPGTHMVKDIAKGENNGMLLITKTAYGDTVLFQGNNGWNMHPWVSDGTEVGTYSLLGSNPINTNISGFTFYKNNFYFSCRDSNGIELWVTDCSVNGTRLFMDIVSGRRGADPYLGYVYRGKLYFSADNGIHGRELWVTDGTTVGTYILSDINQGVNSSNPSYYFEYNGLLYFTAGNNVNGRELWRTDGTVGGTAMVKDILADTASSSPRDFFRYKKWLCFIAFDANGHKQLYFSDGTAGNTFAVMPSYSISGSSVDADITPVVYNGAIYVSANYDSSGQELWKIEDTIDYPSEWMQDVAVPCGQTIEVNGGYFDSYRWSTGATTQSILVNKGGIYWLRVTNNLGTFTDTFSVTFIDTTTVPFKVDDKELKCMMPLDINVDGYDTYYWSTGDTVNATTLADTGFYWVQVENNCGVFSDTFRVTNYGIAKGKPEVEDVTVYCGVPVQVSIPDGYYDYKWSSGENSSEIYVRDIGLYYVTVSDDCSTYVDTFWVFGKGCVYLPDVFSPNKDGINDWFYPHNVTDASGYEFAVYNRWGQRVFFSTTPNEGWNGFYGADFSPVGTYNWYVKYRYENTMETKKGTVVLIR